MGNGIQTFEVKVEVKQRGSRHFSSHVGMYIENKITKMKHIDARTHQQAIIKAEKYGHPISVRKVDIERMNGNMEDLLLLEPYGAKNPYPNAISMDEMIWKKKNKRAGRIENQVKDKRHY